VVKKTISPTEGLTFGLLLLGQITGILAGTTLLGFLADSLFDTGPLLLAVGVLAGSIWATATVLVSVRKKLVSEDG